VRISFALRQWLPAIPFPALLLFLDQRKHPVRQLINDGFRFLPQLVRITSALPQNRLQIPDAVEGVLDPTSLISVAQRFSYPG
jgi:hypothetical protein